MREGIGIHKWMKREVVKNSALGRVFVKFACAKCGRAIDGDCGIERYKRNGDAGLLADAYGRDVKDCPILAEASDTGVDASALIAAKVHRKWDELRD